MSLQNILSRLNEITSSYNFIRIIASIMLRDFCSPLDSLGQRNAREHLNYSEGSFLIGLWIKNAKKSNKIEFEINAGIAEVYELMERLHFSFIEEGPRMNEGIGSVSEFMTNGFIFKEAFFYTATGAYDYQYAKRTPQKYKYDEEWMEKTKGFSTTVLNEFFIHVKKEIHKKLNSKDRKLHGLKTPDDVVRLFTLTYSEMANGNKEYENIISNFTIELEKGCNTQLSSVGDFNEYQKKPLIKLSDESYFVPFPFYLAEAIYESPFYWMLLDKGYCNEALSHRGRVGEEMVFDQLSIFFGRDKIFKGVKIKENKSKIISDIDVCAIHEDKAIIFQIKSKKLTALSKQGNIEKIKEDFKKAVEDAFLQGIECQKAIRDSSKFNFVSEEGIDIQKEFASIKDIYIICVVLDVYPAISHSAHILLYEKYKESTICLSIFDLEVICRYLNDAKTLVDYFSKRIKNCRNYYADNELCYLGFYLKHDLKELKGRDGILIENDYGSFIDGLYYPELSGYKKNEKKEKIGRNEKCPCGSDLKYKKCHGKSA